MSRSPPGSVSASIALVENPHRLRQAIRNIRGFLSTDNAAPADAEQVG
jgi:alanine-synthesizing transaminase